MSAKAIVEEIRKLGRDSYKKVLFNHGVKEPCFGVKIEDLKKIQKRIKKDYRLALELYETGNYDAMYLAGLIADPGQMTKADLQRWAEKAYGGSLPGYTVAGVAADGTHGWEMGLKWIDSDKECVAISGWSTLAAVTSVKVDAELDQQELKRLLQRVERTIHEAPDRVRYTMNAFMIALGSYVKSLTPLVMKVAEKIGRVHADLGNNSCQVPFVPDYIRKVEARGRIGKKRKTARC